MKHVITMVLLALGTTVLAVGCRTSGRCSCQQDYQAQSEPARIRIADTDPLPPVPPPPLVDAPE